MLDTSFTQVVATTLKGYSNVITDNVTTQQVILWMLGRMGGIESRPGASSIVEPVIGEDNASVQSYAGPDPLNTSESGGITATEAPWRQLGGVMQLTGIDKFKNSGASTQVINLWDAKGKQLALTMRRRLNTMLYGDGTGNNNKDIMGLLLAIENGDAWATFQEIDSNLNTFWRNAWFDGGNYASGTLLTDGMRDLYYACQGGGDAPQLIITTQTLMKAWEKTLIPNERYLRAESDENMAKSGFENFKYKNAVVTWDEDMQPNVLTAATDDAQGMVALNLNYLKFVFGEGYEFTFTDPVSPDNQDLESVKCLMYGNLVLSNRRRQGRNNFDTP